MPRDESEPRLTGLEWAVLTSALVLALLIILSLFYR